VVTTRVSASVVDLVVVAVKVTVPNNPEPRVAEQKPSTRTTSPPFEQEVSEKFEGHSQVPASCLCT
jgi:hypothetical protein